MFGQSLLSAFGSAACTTDTDQLFTTDVQTTSVATYQLNNATTSIPNNTYPATASNQTYTTGKFGNAIEANGSNTRVDISNLNVSTFSAITISAWVYWQSTDAPRIFSGKSGSVTNRQTFEAHCNANRVRYIANHGKLYDAPITLATGWHHFAVTDDYNGNHIIYVDGQAITSNLTATSNYAANSSATMFYGMRNTGSVSGSETKGIVDQLRIFNTVLPQSAITVLYNETTTTATSASIDYVDTNPNSVAYYKMSDATDQLGNYNGTATDVNFNTEGKFGFAGAFNGSSSIIDTNIPASLFNTSTWSISLWIKPTNTNFKYFLGNTNSGILNGFAMGMYGDGSRFDFITRNGSATVGRFQGGTPIADVWTNIVIINNNNSFSFYQDNALMTNYGSYTQPVSGGSYTSSLDFILGRAGAYNSQPYAGSIDQVRIYDSALSAADVTALYNEIECPAVAVTNAFNTVIYTGNSGTQQISTVGFQPDMVWTKQRSSPSRDHLLNDSVRGANKILYPNLSNAEDTAGGSGSAYFNSFDSNGYTVGSSNYYNGSSLDYVSWNFKAGGNSNTFNVDGIGYSSASAAGLATGTNNPTGASVNTVSGFSIIKLNSGSVANSDRTVAHGLGVKPSFVLFRRTSQSAWFTWSAGLSPESYYLYLQDSYGVGGLTQSGNAWGNQSFTDTTISWRNSWTFSPNEELIAYVWADISGYQKSGSYIGNDTTNTIYVGFKPRFLLIKCSSNGGTNKEWVMIDSTMDPSTPITKRLEANTSDAEATDTINVTMNNDGWTMPNGTSTASINQIGFSYVFLAIA